MRFSDFLDPKRGPEALMRLALYPLLILVTGSLVIGIAGQLGAADLLLGLLLLVLASPLAYVIREARQDRREEPRTRRGAERTPLLPQDEEEE
jgi:hypothetical protein